MAVMETTVDPEFRVFEFLERYGIPFRRVAIDPSFADTEAFCAHYGIAPEISGNTIIVASRRVPRRYVACVVTATMRLDVNHRVREILTTGKLSFATAEETLALTGMLIGGVTPFALPGRRSDSHRRDDPGPAGDPPRLRRPVVQGAPVARRSRPRPRPALRDRPRGAPWLR